MTIVSRRLPLKMWHRLAHRVGRSSQATTAAVDKSTQRLEHKNSDTPVLPTPVPASTTRTPPCSMVFATASAICFWPSRCKKCASATESTPSGAKAAQTRSPKVVTGTLWHQAGMPDAEFGSAAPIGLVCGNSAPDDLQAYPRQDGQALHPGRQVQRVV